MTEWKMVPVEPTEEMRISGGLVIHRTRNFSVNAHRADICWREMIKTAPTPPEPEGGLAEWLEEVRKLPRHRVYEMASCGMRRGEVVYADGLQALLDKFPRNQGELARLEREIAEEFSLHGVVCNEFPDLQEGEWVDIGHNLEKYVRYLELRGLLERHPTDPNLVRLKETTTEESEDERD